MSPELICRVCLSFIGSGQFPRGIPSAASSRPHGQQRWISVRHTSLYAGPVFQRGIHLRSVLHAHIMAQAGQYHLGCRWHQPFRTTRSECQDAGSPLLPRCPADLVPQGGGSRVKEGGISSKYPQWSLTKTPRALGGARRDATSTKSGNTHRGGRSAAGRRRRGSRSTAGQTKHECEQPLSNLSPLRARAS